MSTFNQNKQNVNTQYNVAGNLNLSDEKSGIVWVKVIGHERFFPSMLKNVDVDKSILDKLELEPDFNVFLHNKNDYNVKYIGEVNMGESIKFHVKPGEYHIASTWIKTDLRTKIFDKLVYDETISQNHTTEIYLCVSQLEIASLYFKNRDPIEFRKATNSPEFRNLVEEHNKKGENTLHESFLSEHPLENIFFTFRVDSGEVIDLEYDYKKNKFKYKR